MKYNGIRISEPQARAIRYLLEHGTITPAGTVVSGIRPSTMDALCDKDICMGTTVIPHPQHPLVKYWLVDQNGTLED